jgi:basic membrane protein A and related proteins
LFPPPSYSPSASASSAGSAPGLPTKLKVGFVYLGPVGDFGWTYQHEVARQELVKEQGDRIETTYLENVGEGSDADRSIEQLVRSGHS